MLTISINPLSVADSQRAVSYHFTLVRCVSGCILPLYSPLFEDFHLFEAQDVVYMGKFSKISQKVADLHPTNFQAQIFRHIFSGMNDSVPRVHQKIID